MKAIDVNEIKTWGERAAEKFQADQILYEEAKQQTVIDCMRAEIADLRAALEATQSKKRPAHCPNCGAHGEHICLAGGRP